MSLEEGLKFSYRKKIANLLQHYMLDDDFKVLKLIVPKPYHQGLHFEL